MKTSKIILVSVAGIFLLLVLTSLLVLRNDLQEVLNPDLSKKWGAVAVGNAKSLEFSSNWIVNIKQGREFKVEFPLEEGRVGSPKVEQREGSLYFEAAEKAPTGKKSYVKITAPSLRQIKTMRGSRINIEGLQLDSLEVVLEQGGIFIGKENQVKHLSLMASGDAMYQVTDKHVNSVDLDVSENAKVNLKGNSIVGNITGQAKVTVLGEVEYLGVQVGKQASLIKGEPESAGITE